MSSLRKMGCALLLLALAGAAQAASEKHPYLAAAYQPVGASGAPPSLGARILWYVPNRVMDLMDVFRLRVRIGPGLAANFRMTDYASFYVGQYDSIYAGLPGPRHPHSIRWPLGKEKLRGIVMAGVDATDNTRHGPEYGVGESDVGIHLLLVGAEAGVDAVEIGDFLGGLVCLDPRGDDYPRKQKPAPQWTSGLSIGGQGVTYRVDPKPETFGTFAARLDYLHLNVQHRVSEPLRATDAFFASDPAAAVAPPQTQFRLGMYVTIKQGKEFELELKPDLEVDVELPNMENKLRIFVESGQANELPQTTKADTDEQGFSVGARKYFNDKNISIDAGIRATWLPEVFARVRWRPSWQFGKWGVRPEARAFWESEDGFGALVSESLTRWLGASRAYVFLEDASVKYTTGEEEYEWGASVKLVRAPSLLDERQRGRNIDWEDTARAQGLRAAISGDDEYANSFRVTVGFRGPLYKKWIYWEVDPGVAWEDEDDYDPTFTLNAGLDLLFWGRAYE